MVGHQDQFVCVDTEGRSQVRITQIELIATVHSLHSSPLLLPRPARLCTAVQCAIRPVCTRIVPALVFDTCPENPILTDWPLHCNLNGGEESKPNLGARNQNEAKLVQHK